MRMDGLMNLKAVSHIVLIVIQQLVPRQLSMINELK